MKSIEAFFNPTTHTQDFRAVARLLEKLGERDLKVAIKAVSANPVDYKVASHLKNEKNEPVVLGWDASGIVTEVGSKVKHYQVGDEVYYAGSIEKNGSNAQFQIVDERIVGKKPKSLDFKEAAAIPLTAITAWESIFDHLGFHAEDKRSILILGAAGGVGSIAIQLLKARTQATVIGTASRTESKRWVRELGADHVIDHRTDLTPQLRNIGYAEVDSILCLNNTDGYFQKFADWLKPFGRVVSIVETEKPVDLGLLKSKSLTFSWEFMFTRSSHQTPDMDNQRLLLNEVSKLLDTKKVQTTLGLDLGELNPANLKKAHEILKSGKAIGKIVLGEMKR